MSSVCEKWTRPFGDRGRLRMRVDFNHTPAIKGGWDEEPQPEQNQIHNVFLVDDAGREMEVTDLIEELDAWERVEHLAFGKPMFWKSPETRIRILSEELATAKAELNDYKSKTLALLGGDKR